MERAWAGCASAGQYGSYTPVYGTLQFIESQAMPTLPDRPARVQVEQKRALQQAEHLGEYNIWYGRWSGESGYERNPRASTRVCLATDAGLTRADYTNSGAYICLHFARGACIYGKDCCYRHCAPTMEDETQTDSPHDVFGRDRHASFRDDMGGTGTWNKDCKTLYVGRICCTPPEPQIVDTLIRHFGEFGVLESVRVLKQKGCAFITYTLRCSAEFAKTAMEEQSLDHDEQINVRWAYDDPNPRAEAMRLRNNAQLMLAAMEARGHLAPQPEYPDAASVPDGWNGGQGHAVEPATKRLRREGQDDDAHGTAIEPISREEHERREAMRLWEEEQRAAAQAAEQEAEAEAAKQAEAAREAARLDAILAGIRGGDGDATEDAIAPTEGQGAHGRFASGAEASEGSRVQAVAANNDKSSNNGSWTQDGGSDDTYLAFLESVGEVGKSAGAETSTAGVESEQVEQSAKTGASSDDLHELPPGVFQPRLPEGWREYLDPNTGHPYYVEDLTGRSTWARPHVA